MEEYKKQSLQIEGPREQLRFDFMRKKLFSKRDLS